MIRRNHLEVGASGFAKTSKSAVCGCCRLTFTYWLGHGEPPRIVCNECQHHWPAGRPETADEKVVRLEEDAKRLHLRAHEALMKAREFYARVARAEAEAKRLLTDRHEWRLLASAVVSEHMENVDGLCSCGRKSCPTLRAARRIAPRKAAEALRRARGMDSEEWENGYYMGRSVIRAEADEPFDGLTG